MQKIKGLWLAATLLSTPLWCPAQEAISLEKVQSFANEVYTDCPEYKSAAYVAKYAQKLERLEIKTQPFSESETYILLSSLGLRNKCNPDLTADTEITFNPETFNPLKYSFNFYAATDITYRVDGTNYIIVIHPKP